MNTQTRIGTCGKRIYNLLKDVPTSCHNATFTIEKGTHWPAGERFRLMPRAQQRYHEKTAFKQLGGEEIIVVVPNRMLKEYFGI